MLYQKKEDLVFLSKYVFGYYINDPSNKNEKFQRIKIRKLIEKLEKEGLDKNKFLKTIKNLKNSDAVISFHVSQNLKKNTYFSEKLNRLILNKEFFKQPHEVIFRGFSDSIRIIGKKYYSVRGKKLDRIINEINNSSFFKVTLGGCTIKKVNQTVFVTKEQ